MPFQGTCNISFCRNDFFRNWAWRIIYKIFAENCVKSWDLGGGEKNLSTAAGFLAGNLSRDTKYRTNLSPLDVSPGQT